MISYSFDRFFVVAKFELPQVEDIKLIMISYNFYLSVFGKGKG